MKHLLQYTILLGIFLMFTPPCEADRVDVSIAVEPTVLADQPADPTVLPPELVEDILTAVAPDFDESPDFMINEYYAGHVTIEEIEIAGSDAWRVTYGGMSIQILDENI